MGADSTSGERPPHMILVPLLSPGHILPMADLGRLLAPRGARVTLVTTPHNAARLQPSADRSMACGLPFSLVSLSLPSTDGSPPLEYECADAIPSASFSEVGGKLLLAMQQFQDPLRRFMATAGATFLISDSGMSCTREVAREVGVPSYLFYSICCFTLYCHRVMPRYFKSVEAEEGEEDKPVEVPGLPHRVQMNREQSRGIGYGQPDWFLDGRAAAEATADGLVINTFSELEQSYVELYSKEMGKKIFPVGPVSLCNRDAGDKATRGGGREEQFNADADTCPQQYCRITNWLDSKAPRSVVYVCLGTLVREHPRQLKEMGAGLRAAGSPFLWVVRGGYRTGELETCLREFEQSMSGSDDCMIVRGWVPQLTILSHPSVGGYLSHCGWNSLAEAITGGLPVATWPCFADQQVNAKFAVDVVGVGVPVAGCEKPMKGWWGSDEIGRQMIGREEVEAAVRKLMDGGEEAEARRARVLELADKAWRALDVGGSSDVNLRDLIMESVKIAKEKVCTVPMQPRTC